MFYPVENNIHLGYSVGIFLACCAISAVATLWLSIYALWNFIQTWQNSKKLIPQLFIVGQIGLLGFVTSLWLILNFTKSFYLEFTGCLIFNFVFIYCRGVSYLWSFTIIIVLYEATFTSWGWFRTEATKWRFCRRSSLINFAVPLIPTISYVLLVRFWLDPDQEMIDGDSGLGNSRCQFLYTNPNQDLDYQLISTMITVVIVNFVQAFSSILGILLLIFVWRFAHGRGITKAKTLCRKLSGFPIINLVMTIMNISYWCTLFQNSSSQSAPVLGEVFNILFALSGLLDVLVFVVLNYEHIKESRYGCLPRERNVTKKIELKLPLLQSDNSL